MEKKDVIISKTFSVPIGREQYIVAIMMSLSFVEDNRVTTGGYMSEEKVQLTFCGFESDYHENNYIKADSPKEGFHIYYSLRVVDGYYTNDFNMFKERHDKNRSANFEVLSF